MRPAWIVSAAGGAALIVLLLVAIGTPDRLAEQRAAGAVSVPEEQATPPRSGGEPLAGTEAAPVRARRIRPALVAPPPIDPSELERVEPRAPLGNLALALPPKPGVPERTLLHRPVATAAGRMEAQGHSIELEGVAATDPEETCPAADGSSWPCGMVARTAFRNWLRGRAIACVVAEPPAEEAVVTECSLGEDDVALWLVENGFARAESGGPYSQAGAKAEAEGRGIFGGGRSR